MKMQNCLVVLSLLCGVSSFASTSAEEMSQRCAKMVPPLRQKLADTERKRADMQELLDRTNNMLRAVGKPPLTLNMLDFEPAIFELTSQVDEMERICNLVEAIKTRFLGGLQGYEMKSFYQRFSEFMSRLELENGNVNMTLSEAQKASLLEAFSTMLRRMPGLVTYAFEKDPMKRAEFEFGLMTDLDAITTIVIDMLQVDRNGVHDVDTLFERLEAKLSQIRREKEL